MIDGFKEGFWYRFNGSESPSFYMNMDGGMDFMLDGKWHQCNSVSIKSNNHASFYDSREPNRVWAWGKGTIPGKDLYMFDELSPAMYNIKKLKELKQNQLDKD